MNDASEIPAANIGNTDLIGLARSNPEAAKEIARLENLMNCGEETKEEFLQLCQLLFNVGSVDASELLLRRNIEYYEGHSLYTRLFGETKPREFELAIGAFKSQFCLELIWMESTDFLVSTFHANGGPLRSDEFAMLSSPCEIIFGYIEQDKVEADVSLRDTDQGDVGSENWMSLHFVNGTWVLAEPSDV